MGNTATVQHRLKGGHRRDVIPRATRPSASRTNWLQLPRAAAAGRRLAVRDALLSGLGRRLSRIALRRPLRCPPNDVQKTLEAARDRFGLPSRPAEAATRS
jgi:hypothetical protein